MFPSLGLNKTPCHSPSGVAGQANAFCREQEKSQICHCKKKEGKKKEKPKTKNHCSQVKNREGVRCCCQLSTSEPGDAPRACTSPGALRGHRDLGPAPFPRANPISSAFWASRQSFPTTQPQPSSCHSITRAQTWSQACPGTRSRAPRASPGTSAAAAAPAWLQLQSPTLADNQTQTNPVLCSWFYHSQCLSGIAWEGLQSG